MIKELIKEILAESKETVENIDEAADKVYNNLKDVAKEMMFSNKISNLKDFIFDVPNEENDKVKEKIVTEINKTIGDGEEFIGSLKTKVNEKLKEKGLEKNFQNLLELFDFGHFKDFLKKFNL